MPITRRDPLILVLLLTFGILRLSFVTKGHLFWIDELRYTNAFLFYDALGQGQFQKAVEYLFHAHGRPGFVLISAIPAGIQLLAQKFNFISLGNPEFMELLRQDKMTMAFNPHFFDIPSIFNVVVGVAIMFVLFKMLQLFVRNNWLLYVGVVVYSTLVNTNFYIRHLVPYDMALLLFLIVLYFVLKEISRKESRKMTAVTTGMLSAFAFSVYPSYYLFVLLIAVLFWLAPQRKIAGFLVHSTSFAAVTGLIELISRWVGNSYIASLRELSTIAIQGTFEEGYIFPLRYLIHVEGVLGVVLIVLFCCFLLVCFRKSSASIKLIYFVLLAGYFYHATEGVVFKKMVFYGRMMHMYWPFLVMAAILFVDSIKNHRLRHRLSIMIAAVSLFSFFSFFKQYVQLEYPLDFGHRYSSRLPAGTVYRTNEQTSSDRIAIQSAQGVLVNAEYFFPIWEQWYPLDTPPEMKLVKAALHPLHFPAYQYEGHSVEDRQRLQQRKIYMRFYAKEYLADAFQK